ncbi:MAG: hypothetical protein IH606_18245 [Burkholderiales bacterium]|nr:hypothetical protein [Burkholderiales bacterium]
MNRDRVVGGWKQFSGGVQEQWCRFVGDEAGMRAAQCTRQAGGFQVRRGVSSENSEREFRDFLYRNRDWNLPGR